MAGWLALVPDEEVDVKSLLRKPKSILALDRLSVAGSKAAGRLEDEVRVFYVEMSCRSLVSDSFTRVYEKRDLYKALKL